MKKDWNKDLSGMNTFRMRVSCRCFVEYGSVEELKAVLADRSFPRPFFPLGGGSKLIWAQAGSMPMPAWSGMISALGVPRKAFGDPRTFHIFPERWEHLPSRTSVPTAGKPVN